jgi:hypothetical protein
MPDDAAVEPNWGVIGLLGHLDHSASGDGLGRTRTRSAPARVSSTGC